MVPLVNYPEEANSQAEAEQRFPGAGEKGNTESLLDGSRVSVQGDGKVLETPMTGVQHHKWTYRITYSSTYLKMVKVVNVM